MKKPFCDLCGEEICFTNPRLESHYLKTKMRDGQVSSVDVYVKTVQTQKADVCIRCGISIAKDLVNELEATLTNQALRKKAETR